MARARQPMASRQSGLGDRWERVDRGRHIGLCLINQGIVLRWGLFAMQQVKIIAVLNCTVLFIFFAFMGHGRNSFDLFACALLISGVAWSIYLCKVFFGLQKKTVTIIICTVLVYILALSPTFLHFKILKYMAFGIEIVFIPWLVFISYLSTLLKNRLILFCILLSSAAILVWPVSRVFFTMLWVSL